MYFRNKRIKNKIRLVIVAVLAILLLLAVSGALRRKDNSKQAAGTVPVTTPIMETVSIEPQADKQDDQGKNTGKSDSQSDEKTLPDDKDSDNTSENKTLEVHFIDVGQGDCTLLVCDGKSMLIDCGPEDSGTLVQLYLSKHNIKKIDYLILTHPDSDHIGGADVIITKYDIDTIYMLDCERDTKAYRNVLEAIEYRNYSYSQPEAGTSFLLGTTKITVLGPSVAADGSNNSSISLMAENGGKRFIFIGDCEYEGEQSLLDNWDDLEADVYKVAHHGSSDSLNRLFLTAVSPDYAVISCGAQNAYGHPHELTLDYFGQSDVKVFRTDEQGTIVIKTSGKEIEISTER